MRLSMFQGKRRKISIACLALLLAIIVLLAALLVQDTLNREASRVPEVLVGVDVGFGGEKDVYRVANAVQGYANLIILGSTQLVRQTENLTRACDYLYQKGFSFIIYIGFSMSSTGLPPKGPDPDFFNRNKERWGNNLLGMYIFDEPGGKQMDYNMSNADKPVPKANNITDAAVHYVLGVEPFASLYRGDSYYAAQWLPLYTSDYALYWFDHLAGYSEVFGEFVRNNSRQITIALNRGAAASLGKEWGTMITWKYNIPPYMEEAEQLYDDMVLSYNNGAKYIVVFNSPDQNPNTTPYGILNQDHFDAIKRFWDYAKAHPRSARFAADTAYVLPRDWAFGFRGPNDGIWGLWPADALAAKVWNDTNALLETNGKNFDIVYETRINDVLINLPYRTLIFWNGTTVTR
jgi:hypothetical protein